MTKQNSHKIRKQGGVWKSVIIFLVCQVRTGCSFLVHWRIQDFPDRGRQLLSWGENLLFGKIFAKNCTKMKEIESKGEGVRVPSAP